MHSMRHLYLPLNVCSDNLPGSHNQTTPALVLWQNRRKIRLISTLRARIIFLYIKFQAAPNFLLVLRICRKYIRISRYLNALRVHCTFIMSNFTSISIIYFCFTTIQNPKYLTNKSDDIAIVSKRTDDTLICF